jgi:tripartite-type tricarboxylate transporter receptor subunit TctC
MFNRLIRSLAFSLLGATAVTTPAISADFYAGKTINLIVGYSSGGGYDVYSRIIARHIARHIPGTPNIVVQNMPGAGSGKAASYVFSGVTCH